MPHLRALRPGVALAVLLLTVIGACKNSTTGSGNGDPDPEVQALRVTVEEAVADAPWILDGFDRLLVAAAGGPADGVTLVLTSPRVRMTALSGPQYSLTVDVDSDGDGTRETTVSGTIDFVDTGFESGGTVTFSGPPGVAASVTGFAQQVDPTTVQVDGITGSFTWPEYQTTITEGNLTIDLSSGLPMAFFDVTFLSDGHDPVTAHMSLQPDGQGGAELEVWGPERVWEFTIPFPIPSS